MAADYQRGVGIRLFVAGEEAVKRAFSGVADSGRKMWAEIALGQKSANPAVVALSRASQEGQAAVGGLAARVGGAANVLGAFGAAGVGVAAVLGGVALAVNNVRETMDWADALQDQADRLGISTDALQKYQYALRVTGGDADAAGEAIEAFDKKFGAALGQYGKRDIKPFAALGFTQADLESFGSMEDALQATIDKIAALENASEQAAIADKLGLSAMLPLIREGTGGFQRLAEEAEALGIVMDRDMVQRAAEAKDQFDTLSQVIDMQLKQSFLDLIPALMAVMNFAADTARAIGDIADAWRDLDTKTTQGINRQVARLEGQRDDLLANLGLMQDNGASAAEIAARNAQISRLQVRIDGLRAELRERLVYTPPTPRPAGDGPRLTPQIPTGGGGAAPKAREPSPEELAALQRAIAAEQRLAVARALGVKATEQAIEEEARYDQLVEKYRKAYPDRSITWARGMAQQDIDSQQWAREQGEWLKSIQSGGEGFQTTEEIFKQINERVDAAIAFDAERRAEWARGVGDATAAGLDAALTGDFGDFLRQTFYRAALQGVSDGVTQAMSGGLGDGVLGMFNFLFGGPSSGSSGFGNGNARPGSNLQTGQGLPPGTISMGGYPVSVGSVLGGFGDLVGGVLGGLFGFGGNRAAGGPMEAGSWYRLAEHTGKPEVMIAGGNGRVFDPASTVRLLQDLTGAGAGGGRAGVGGGGGGPSTVSFSFAPKIPAGHIGDQQLMNLLRVTHDQAVASVIGRIGDLTRGDAINFKFLKD